MKATSIKKTNEKKAFARTVADMEREVDGWKKRARNRTAGMTQKERWDFLNQKTDEAMAGVGLKYVPVEASDGSGLVYRTVPIDSEAAEAPAN